MNIEGSQSQPSPFNPLNTLDIERIVSFGESSKSPTLLTSTVHNGYQPHSENNTQIYIKEYQSDHSDNQYTTQAEEHDRDAKAKLEIELGVRLKKIEQLYLREREYQRTIHELKLKLDQKNEDDYYRAGNTTQLEEDNTRLNSENVRLKKELLSQEFQMRMVETEIQALRQEDNSGRLREQIKIKEQYHKKAIKELQYEREIQIDRIVKLFEDYLHDLELHYKGIIRDNNIHISQNIQSTYNSVQRAFNRNKEKEINRIGMQFINHDTYEASRVKSKSREEPTHRIEDNSTQVIQRIKEQLMTLNRLKEKELEEIRNVRDKYSYLDTETEYQKVYLGLIVEMESLRYNRIIHKSSLEEQAQIIQLRSEIKILNEELSLVRRERGDNKEMKLKKQVDILKDYIKEENESKMKFFSDLQKTKTLYQQISAQNMSLKKQIQMLSSRCETMKTSSKYSNDYRILEHQYNSMKQQLIGKSTRIIELQRQIKSIMKPTVEQSNLFQLQQILKNKQLDQLKLFSEIESLQDEIVKIKTEKDEYLDVIKRLGANIETEQELKNMLNSLEKQNFQLRSENQMIKQSLTQENIAKATSEAGRLITERYEREIHILKITIDKIRQELIATQKMNGQLLQDLRIVNQHTKTKGVAVEHLWEVKNAEYQNIMAQIKRIQTL